MKPSSPTKPPSDALRRALPIALGALAGAAVGVGVGVALGRTKLAPRPTARTTTITFTAGSGLDAEAVAPAGAVVDAVFDDGPAPKVKGWPEPKLPSRPGPSNPRSVVELLSGPVDWAKVKDPTAYVEKALGQRWEELIDPRRSKALFDPERVILAGTARLLRGLRAPVIGSIPPPRSMTCDDWLFQFAPRLLARLAADGVAYPTQGRAVREAYERCVGFDGDGWNRVGQGCPPGFEWCPTETPIAWMRRGSAAPRRPSVLDPVQGLVPDCYFISSLASIAWVWPEVIMGAIRPVGGDRYGVRFAHSYQLGPDGRPAAMVPGAVEVGVSDRLACLLQPPGVTDAQVAALSWPFASAAGGSFAESQWPALLEKAAAAWTTGDMTDRPNMLSGRLGTSVNAVADFVDAAQWRPEYAQNWSEAGLSADLAAWVVARCARGNRTSVPITALVPDPGAQPGEVAEIMARSLVLNHQYSVLGKMVSGGVSYIVVRNPWGHACPRGANTITSGTWEGLTLGRDGVSAIASDWFTRLFTAVFSVARV